ncbi:MAG: PIN domain-containing protein [Fibrobacter sp.]|nr:PIN domain-containing protein [Fibrobacter sp.]
MATVRLLPDFDNSKRRYLLDTNFLFCVFADTDFSTKNITRQKKYLAFVETAKKNNFELFVSSFALSEYFNRVLRFHFQIWERKKENSGKDFKKDFRISDECKACIAALKEEVDQIAKICIFIDDSFSLYKKENYFPYFEAFDFNDSLFAHVALANNCVLVTEDRDFNAPVFKNLNVLTANDTMYKSRES